MKRSEINGAIRDAEARFRKAGQALPDFASWDLEAWRAGGARARRLVAAGMGWDVTDFGEGDFARKGLLLFTARNGTPGGGTANRPYAEKIMVVRRDQLTPMHRHASKTEDIINRAASEPGARLAVRLFACEADGTLSRERAVTAHLDGAVRALAPGSVVTLAPGESITLFPGTFHAFWGEGGDVLAGEVSTVNDDATDNFFAEPTARFTAIIEDEAIYRPLTADLAAP